MREIAGLLAGRVAAADDHERLVPEDRKGTVAGGAVGDTLVLKLMFARRAEVTVSGADRDDDALCLDDFALDGQLQRAAGEIDRIDLAQILDPGPEAGRLLLHLGHEGGSLDAVAESGEVLDGRGGGQEPSGLLARDQEGVEVGTRGVDGCCPAGTAGSDDDDVFHEGLVDDCL